MKRILSALFAALMATAVWAGKPVTVIITAGQSNTAGRCYNDSLPEYIKALGSQYKYCQWSFTNGNTRKAEAEGVFRPFWPEMESKNKPGRFAYDAIVYYLVEQALGEPFYVIKHAEGGTAIDPACRSSKNHHWSADEAYLDSTTSVNHGGLSLLKALEDNIDKSLDALKKQGLEPDIKCMLWHQGESDRGKPDRYHDNLKALVAHVRQHLVDKTGKKAYARLPFICGTVPTNSKQYKKGVEDAMYQIEKEDPDFHVIPMGEGTFIGDQLHFDRRTAERLGRGMYSKMLQLKTMKTALPDIRVATFWGNREAAISYTFDDGLLEHYTLVFPQLKRLGLKASFCIIGSKVGKDQKGTPCMTWEQLREMAADGQEITSHGFRHQSMERLEGEALRYEVQHNDTLIVNNVGIFPRTYFFPGNRKTPKGLAFTAKDRVGTRNFQVSFGSKRDSLWMANWIARLLKQHEWGVTMTHGITTGYDCFPDPQVLWQHLEQVASMQDRIWIATFHDVAAYTAERDTISLDIRQERNSVICVTPKTPLDEQIFCQPLTLVVDAIVSEARQNNKPLPIIHKNGQTLLDFNPHAGRIEIKLIIH